MSLTDFIEKLQRKPRHIRVQILWLAVFISMIIIGSLWLISFKYSLEKTQSPALSEEVSGSLEGFKGQIPHVKENLGTLKNLFEESTSQEESPFETEQSTSSPANE